MRLQRLGDLLERFHEPVAKCELISKLLDSKYIGGCRHETARVCGRTLQVGDDGFPAKKKNGHEESHRGGVLVECFEIWTRRQECADRQAQKKQGQHGMGACPQRNKAQSKPCAAERPASRDCLLADRLQESRKQVMLFSVVPGVERHDGGVMSLQVCAHEVHERALALSPIAGDRDCERGFCVLIPQKPGQVSALSVYPSRSASPVAIGRSDRNSSAILTSRCSAGRRNAGRKDRKESTKDSQTQGAGHSR